MRKPDKMTDRDNVSEKCNCNTGTEMYFTIIVTSCQLGDSRSV